jgi:Xaa-Pro aminopeptidase
LPCAAPHVYPARWPRGARRNPGSIGRYNLAMNQPNEPTLAIDVYRKRRERVLAALRAAGGGVAIVPTAPEVVRNRDADYPYRHDSYFYYLTGFTEPQGLLVLDASAGGSGPASILFCRAKNEEREIWEGFRFGPEAPARRSASTRRLPSKISRARCRDPRRQARAALRARQFGRTRRAGAPLARRGAGKSRSGVAAPRRASTCCRCSTKCASSRTATNCRSCGAPARSRRKRIAARWQTCFCRRARVRTRSRTAVHVPPTRRARAGLRLDRRRRRNACVLHYAAGNTIARRRPDPDRRRLRARRLRVRYHAHVPANGRFTPAQREMYDIVLAAQ